MVLAPTSLLHSIYPVGIIVIHLILRELTTRDIVNLIDVITGIGIHVRIEILLFQQHGVLVTVQQFHTVRLIGSGQTEAIGYARITTCATLGLDLDNTITTL